MRKLFVILLLQMISTISWGQSPNNTAQIYLTSYTFSHEKSEIGIVKPKAGIQVKSIKVTGKNASAFSLGKDNVLTLAQKNLASDVKWVDLELLVKTNDGDFLNNFRIVKNEFLSNKVIAHRGAWKNTGAAENSIGALNFAVDMGCEGSEFDVHMSSDSIPVVNHDEHVQGISIAKTRASELTKLKLSNGETLPTLENYLEAGMKQNKTKLILEIKPSELGKEHSIASAKKVLELVESMKAQAWVDYISFDYDICKTLIKLAPYSKVAYLTGDKTPAELASDKFYGLDYHFGLFPKNPTWISEAKQHKLTVNVWTVNERDEMQTLLDEGVDFITTNEPEILLDIVSRK